MIDELIAKCIDKNIEYELRSRSLDFSILRGNVLQKVRIPLAVVDILTDTKILDFRF